MRVSVEKLIVNNMYFLDVNDLTGESETDKKCLRLMDKYEGKCKFLSLDTGVAKFQKGTDIFEIYCSSNGNFIYFDNNYKVMDENVGNEPYFIITFEFYM